MLLWPFMGYLVLVCIYILTAYLIIGALTQGNKVTKVLRKRRFSHVGLYPEDHFVNWDVSEYID